MHDRNSKYTKETILTIYDYIDRPIECEHCGFGFLFEKINKYNRVNKDEDETKSQLYGEGKFPKSHIDEFSDKSVICRYILDYYTEFENRIFINVKDLLEWLISNCPVYIKLYQGQKTRQTG